MIKFDKISGKNFFSIGNIPLEYTFPTGVHHISGANGTGKSSIVSDLIHFALFGKPYRKITINRVVNTSNQKECEVKIHFSKKDDKYIVHRGLKPNFFKIFKNKKAIDESSLKKNYQKFLEDEIFNFDERIFETLSIKSMTRFSSFFAMTKGAKRELIENLFDLHIFSQMLFVNKEHISEMNCFIMDKRQEKNAKEMLRENERQHLEKIMMFIHDQTQKAILQIKDHEKDIQTKKDFKQSIVKKLNKANFEEQHKLIIIDHKKVKKNIQSTKNKQIIIQQQIKQKKEDQRKYKDICGDCPKIKHFIDVTDNSKLETELTNITNKLNELIKSSNEYDFKIDDLNEKISLVVKLETELSIIDRDILSIELKIINIKETLNEHSTLSKQDIKNNIEILSKDIEQLTFDLNRLGNESKHLEFSNTLLKTDEFKNYLIRTYLPLINKLLNGYLQEFNFHVQVEFDTSFNVEIKTKLKEDFSFENFSEGEKKKLNICFVFALIDFFRLKYGKSINNILILDEFSSGLDVDSEPILFQILDKISTQFGFCIFTMSHNKLIITMDVNQIEVTTENGFTKIKTE